MDELLQKLLEAEVLSEETKQTLTEAFNTKLEEALSAAKEEAAADVRAELTEQFIAQKETLIEALDTKVGEYLELELTELKEDIDRFRDLEAEKAQEIVEAKTDMANDLKNDLGKLVEQLDTFLEMRLASEMEELREDLDEVRKNEFGRKIYEAVQAEFVETFADTNSAEATLRETQKRLEDAEAALIESERKLYEHERSQKLSTVLSPLQGRSRDVMEAILSNVETDALEEAYSTFIGRVVRETEEKTSEKEEPVLAEGDSKKTSKDDKKVPVKEQVVITGDKETITESDDTSSKSKLDELRKLAGIV